ncbi:MAG TPA: prepilin-type N-terminal cleavage/methylation domain-containing protein [Gemmatimonadales bacterium]|jgi:prepilin-type N-terminal cleavage/methylation domain-containing protein|nr:prepilin-type N-terminal cleavage/methylation domain-containing protein [Gemmatimonadales bacterium]
MRSSRGFTLIEVMIALTLSALVVLLAHEIFSGVVDGVARLDTARAALDRSANARRWLIEAFGSLQTGVDSAGSFEGHPDQVGFASWQRVAPSGLQRERILLHQAGKTLVAQRGAEVLVLKDSVARVAFDYLLEPGANTTWAREWLSPVSAPLAVRIRVAYLGLPVRADTLLVLIGWRG